jgi:AAA domain-containing protein
MALKEVDPATARRKFIAIDYGDPGTGKTRFATAYPPEWGRAAYIAIDKDGHRLDSVLPQHRDKLTPFVFDGDNPIDNLNEIAVHDWKGDGYGVLIIDTFTHGIKAALSYAAKVNLFPAKDRIYYGPKDATITQGLPVPGDYNGTQWMVERWLETLFTHQTDIHIIVVCHADMAKRKPTDPASVEDVGGPATVGTAIMRSFPSWFPVVVRLTVEAKTGLDRNTVVRYRAITSMQGAYIARIKEANEKGNPMPVVDLQNNPEHWYREYINHFMKEEINAASAH